MHDIKDLPRLRAAMQGVDYLINATALKLLSYHDAGDAEIEHS
jgi:hypothetical protein